MVSSRHKNSVDRWLAPIGLALARTGITPSGLTLTIPVLGTAACVWFYDSRQTLLFCLLITAIGACDALDGVLARVTNRVTKFGGYLDAVCDRYFEAIVVLTVAAVTGYWALSMIFLAGALLVSYAKARAAMEVTISNLEWPDLMERVERNVVFILGLALSALVDWTPLGWDLFWWTLVMLVVLVHMTVLQRILRARRFIEARGSSPGKPAPRRRTS